METRLKFKKFDNNTWNYNLQFLEIPLNKKDEKC